MPQPPLGGERRSMASVKPRTDVAQIPQPARVGHGRRAAAPPVSTYAVPGRGVQPPIRTSCVDKSASSPTPPIAVPARTGNRGASPPPPRCGARGRRRAAAPRQRRRRAAAPPQPVTPRDRDRAGHRGARRRTLQGGGARRAPARRTRTATPDPFPKPSNRGPHVHPLLQQPEVRPPAESSTTSSPSSSIDRPAPGEAALDMACAAWAMTGPEEASHTSHLRS